MNVDLETQLRLLNKYQQNFRHAIEDHLSVPLKEPYEDPVTGRLISTVPFRLNPAQDLLHKLVQSLRRRKRPVRILALKGRQMGISTYLCAHQLFKTILNPQTYALTIAHEQMASEEMLSKIKRFLEQLPPWLQPQSKYDRMNFIDFSTDRTKDRAQNPGLNSKLFTDSAEKPQVGRSLMLKSVHMSEVAFWDKRPEETFLSIMNTMPDSPETFAFLETTANGAGGLFYDLWKEASRDPEIGWYPFFFPFYMNPEYQITQDKWPDMLGVRNVEELLESLPEEEKRIATICGITPEQAAFMRYAVMVKCGGDFSKFLQEYAPMAEECFLVQGDTIFNKEVIRRYSASCKMKASRVSRFRVLIPKTSFNCSYEPDPKGPLQIFEQPQKHVKYVLGVDVAGGIEGRDRSVIQVLRVAERPVQVAEFMSDIVPVHKLAAIVVWLAREYNNALVMPETNSVGQALIPIIRDEYFNIASAETPTSANPKPSNRLGFDSNSATSHVLKTRFIGALNDEDVELFSPNVVKEMTTFVRDSKGKMGAAKTKGSHDDCLTAIGLALLALDQVNGSSESGVGFIDENTVSGFNPKAFMTAMGWTGIADLGEQSWVDM